MNLNQLVNADQAKQLRQAVIALMTHDKERQAGVLDAEGVQIVSGAEVVCAQHDGRAVAAAFLDWTRNPVKFDGRRKSPQSNAYEAMRRPMPRHLRDLQR